MVCKSIFFEDRAAAAILVGDNEESCLPPFPAGSIQGIISYVVCFPIFLPLYLTCPDMNKEKHKRYFIVTFVVSICWIAIFACKYFLFVCFVCCI